MDPERSGSFSGGVFLCPKEARGVLTGSKTFKEKMHKTFEAAVLVGMHKNNKIVGIKKDEESKRNRITVIIK